MKRLGLTIYLITNIGLSILYVYEIIKYFQGTYNYDGMRYLIPIALADFLFILSFVVILFYYRFSKVSGFLFALVLLHNIAHACGVERIPFLGLIVAVVSIFYVWTLNYKHTKNVSSHVGEPPLN